MVAVGCSAHSEPTSSPPPPPSRRIGSLFLPRDEGWVVNRPTEFCRLGPGTSTPPPIDHPVWDGGSMREGIPLAVARCRAPFRNASFSFVFVIIIFSRTPQAPPPPQTPSRQERPCPRAPWEPSGAWAATLLSASGPGARRPSQPHPHADNFLRRFFFGLKNSPERKDDPKEPPPPINPCDYLTRERCGRLARFTVPNPLV